MITYLGCFLDNTLSGESMAIKAMAKIGDRLKFLHRNQSFLSPTLRRLLCKTLLQAILNYACATWYAILNKKVVNSVQNVFDSV